MFTFDHSRTYNRNYTQGRSRFWDIFLTPSKKNFGWNRKFSEEDFTQKNRDRPGVGYRVADSSFSSSFQGSLCSLRP